MVNNLKDDVLSVKKRNFKKNSPNINESLKQKWLNINCVEADPVFWLATRAGNMGLSVPLGIFRIGPARKKI